MDSLPGLKMGLFIGSSPREVISLCLRPSYLSPSVWPSPRLKWERTAQIPVPKKTRFRHEKRDFRNRGTRFTVLGQGTGKRRPRLSFLLSKVWSLGHYLFQCPRKKEWVLFSYEHFHIIKFRIQSVKFTFLIFASKKLFVFFFQIQKNLA